MKESWVFSECTFQMVLTFQLNILYVFKNQNMKQESLLVISHLENPVVSLRCPNYTLKINHESNPSRNRGRKATFEHAKLVQTVGEQDVHGMRQL